MSVWFIFNSQGKFLFKTSDVNRTNLTRIPPGFDATYVIQDPPEYNPELDQSFLYNIATGIVNITINNSLNNINSGPFTQPPEDNSDDIEELRNRIADLENKIEILQIAINNILPTIDQTQLDLSEIISIQSFAFSNTT